MHFRELPNPGKPVLLLLHGMFASGTLNWFRAFEALSEHFHIIAPDMRGHGRSIRGKRFSLDHCADDIEALLEHLGHDKVISVGYSMGGAITQRIWERYPKRLAGMVLTATGYQVNVGINQLKIAAPFMTAVVSVARIIDSVSKHPRKALRNSRLPFRRFDSFGKGKKSSRKTPTDSALLHLRRDLRRTNFRVQLEAAREMSSYDGSHMIGNITVPAAVLVTERDALFSAEHQSEMAARIPGAKRFSYDGGHVSCTQEGFAPALTEACLHVSARTR